MPRAIRLSRATERAAPTAPPPCAVVVVHYRGADDTLACLQSIREHAPGVPTIVVDNASPDGSGTDLAARLAGDPGLRLLRSPANGGFGSGANQGIDLALRSWPDLRHVLLLNPDARLTAGALSELQATARRHPAAGIVGCRILTDDGLVWFANGRVPRWTLSGFHVAAPAGRREHSAGFVTGCAMLVDAALLRDGMRFDEGYFLYCEDADLCERVRRAGRELWVTQDAVVLHRGGGSQPGPAVLGNQTAHQLYWLTRSKVRFARRHLRWHERALFAVAALLAKPLLGIAVGRGTAFLAPYLRGLADGWRTR